MFFVMAPTPAIGHLADDLDLCMASPRHALLSLQQCAAARKAYSPPPTSSTTMILSPPLSNMEKGSTGMALHRGDTVRGRLLYHPLKLTGDCKSGSDAGSAVVQFSYGPCAVSIVVVVIVGVQPCESSRDARTF
jgi:hypothetical protein